MIVSRSRELIKWLICASLANVGCDDIATYRTIIHFPPGPELSTAANATPAHASPTEHVRTAAGSTITILLSRSCTAGAAPKRPPSSQGFGD